MHEGGWLNNLLTISPVPAKVESPGKEKKSRKGKVAETQIQSTTDEWGAPASSSDQIQTSGSTSSSPSAPQKAPTDDWGSPSTSSDWDTPGSSGGSKEEW